MFLKIHTGRHKSVQYSSYTDEALIACYRKNQDAELIVELFHRYTHLVYGICLRYLHDSEMCKDAAMEIFESLFKKLLVHEVAGFKHWLHAVTKNYCLMALRKRSVREKILRNLQLLEKEQERDPVAETDREGHEWRMGRMLEEALSALCADQHVCIRLLYLEQQSYRNISRITGFSMKQVKSHVQNGKRNLKNHLSGKYEPKRT